MIAGGFLGFLGLFLSAFVPRMEFWILTYGALTGQLIRSELLPCSDFTTNTTVFFLKNQFQISFRRWFRFGVQSLFHGRELLLQKKTCFGHRHSTVWYGCRVGVVSIPLQDVARPLRITRRSYSHQCFIAEYMCLCSAY